MKTLTRIIAVATLLATLVSPATAGDLRDEDPQTWERAESEVFVPLFEALQAGDVSAIKRLLDADLFEQYHVLLERNSAYPQYLKDYYRGATFELRGIEDEGDRYTADVVIQWPDGRRIPVRMSAKSLNAKPRTGQR